MSVAADQNLPVVELDQLCAQAFGHHRDLSFCETRKQFAAHGIGPFTKYRDHLTAIEVIAVKPSGIDAADSKAL